MAEITASRRTRSQPPGGMQRHHPAGEHAAADAAETRCRDHVGKDLRARKLPDRLDEIAIGILVARDRAAEHRDDVEGIEVVERIETGNVDGREFETEKPPA